jgi:hypothetical protein
LRFSYPLKAKIGKNRFLCKTNFFPEFLI